MRDGDDYYEETLYQELWRKIGLVCEELKERSEGRNPHCWPLVSFGWKDADLHAEGCTGIQAIVNTIERQGDWLLVVEIGGHKTVADPCEDTDLEEEVKQSWHEVCLEYVVDAAMSCHGNSHWTGDDWSLSYEDTLHIPFTLESEPGAIADYIIRQARARLEPFEQTMTALDQHMTSIYDQIHDESNPEESSR